MSVQLLRQRMNWLRISLLLILSLSTPSAFSQMLASASLPRMTDYESKPLSPDLWHRNALLGDWGGLRSTLDNYGITFSLDQTSDYLGNTQGGIRQGFVYDGLLDLELEVDLNKAIGWTGAKIHLSGYGIQGQDLSTQNIGNIMTATGIEAQPSIAKLGELFIEQRFLGNQFRLKAGLLEADRYFMTSPTANIFINSTFGFPDSWQSNMPGGGPAYPNASPGVLISMNLDPQWKLIASIMNGKPSGPTTSPTSYGTTFPLGDGALSWMEIDFKSTFTLLEKSLPGNFKLGGWYNSSSIDNVTEISSGRTFNQPISTTYRGQYAVYGVADQTLFRERDYGNQGLSAFTRLTYNPQTDRNLVTWYFDTGLAYAGPFNGRPNDILALGFGWAKFTPYLNSQISEQNAQAGTQTPLPKPESVIELTYQAPMSNWLMLQPFFQYSINPGGKAPMPNNLNQAIPNATIVGLRANVSF